MTKKIIIISGDPNSINSEIIYKSWKKCSKSQRKKIYLISNHKLLIKQFDKLKYPIKLIKVNGVRESSNDDRLKIIDVDLKFTNPFKVPKKSASKFVISSLNLAHKIALKRDVCGIINCPINKNLINKNETSKNGVTEFLASKCKIRNNSEVMLINNKKLSVSPITTHIDLKDVSKKLKTKSIINKTNTINRWFKERFNRKPKIGILGLNPHNSEFRKNSEELKIIIPAINHLKKKGLKVLGPLVSDTIFINQYKNYDVIVGMYHDQVLAPFKTLFKFNAINITLGLKYKRVSPDHGVASELIGKRKANPQSLIDCLKFLSK